MALSQDDWTAVTAALQMMRGLGCAVCVFTPDDVESVGDDDDAEMPMSTEEAKTWMETNRRRLEEHLSTCGNQFITDNMTNGDV